MKLDKLLKNNTFLINSCICLVALLAICYLGINFSVRGTYSVDSCVNGSCSLVGQYSWNDYINFDAFGEVGEYVFETNFNSNGTEYKAFQIYKSSAYNLSVKYVRTDGTVDYIFDVVYDKEDNKFIDSEFYYSVIYKTGMENHKIINYNVITDLGDVDFYNWFVKNALPNNKCYYNSTSQSFVWTNDASGKTLYSVFDTQEKCSNASMKLTLTDTENTLQKCLDFNGDGTCNEWDTSKSEIIIDLKPGTYAFETLNNHYFKGVKDGGYVLDSLSLVSWNNGATSYNGADVSDDLYPEVNKIYSDGNSILLNQDLYQYGLKVNWQKTYTITYTTIGSERSSDVVKAGETVKLPKVISEGEEVDGYWLYEDSNVSGGWIAVGQPGQTYTPDADRTLLFVSKGVQEPVEPSETYSVFYFDGMQYEDYYQTYKETGEVIEIADNRYEKEGYEFIGWNTKPDGTGVSYQPGDVYSEDDYLSLVAQWQKIFDVDETYTVDETNKYLVVDVGTTMENLNAAVTLVDGYEMDVDVKLVNGINVLHTNGKLQIKKSDGSLYKEYSIVVLGDVDGDGALYYSDYVKTYNHVYKTRKPSSSKKQLEGIYAIAGDYSNDGNIEYDDYVKIFNKVKEIRKNGGTN